MKKAILLLVAIAALSCAGQVRAAPTATPQQSRMKMCATQYHIKKIAKSDYRKFMSECLKNHQIAKPLPNKSPFTTKP